MSNWLARPLDRVLDWLPREFFLLAVFAFLIGMAALAEELGLSEAIGALMAGVVLSETSVREEIEERFFSFRDVFAALFFFVFGLSIDVGALGSVGWILAAAVVAALVGKIGAGYVAGLVRRPHPAAELQRRRRARRARRVHDHPRPARERERRISGAYADEARRVRRALRARHRDDRSRADEGVEGDRPSPVSRP